VSAYSSSVRQASVSGKSRRFQISNSVCRSSRIEDILEPESAETTRSHHTSGSIYKNIGEATRRQGNGLARHGRPERYHAHIKCSLLQNGSEILIPQGKGKAPRRSRAEAARLRAIQCGQCEVVGLNGELPIDDPDTQAYRQFGNSVVPAVAEAVQGRSSRFMLGNSCRAEVPHKDGDDRPGLTRSVQLSRLRKKRLRMHKPTAERSSKFISANDAGNNWQAIKQLLHAKARVETLRLLRPREGDNQQVKVRNFWQGERTRFCHQPITAKRHG